MVDRGRRRDLALEISDVTAKPRLFSMFIYGLLAHGTLTDVCDLPKPKLAFFVDEAHLLFDGATRQQIELMGCLTGRRIGPQAAS